MKISLKKTLKWDRITLKRVSPTISFAKQIFKKVDKNREHLSPWFPRVDWTKTVEDSLQFLFSCEEQYKKKEKLEYAIFLWRQYIGQISAFNISEKNKSCEIWYWIDKEYTKKWYMTEAVKILEKEAFENPSLNRIQIKCDERNIASAGVVKKCWYFFEGKIRENTFSDYHNDMRNTLLFSKLKSEYLSE